MPALCMASLEGQSWKTHELRKKTMNKDDVPNEYHIIRQKINNFKYFTNLEHENLTRTEMFTSNLARCIMNMEITTIHASTISTKNLEMFFQH